VVSGRGILGLRRAGLDVSVGCLRERAETLNESYIHWIKTGRPFVILKAAMTLDGKIATAGGESRWITGEKARQHAHRLRRQVDAVMAGIGTVLLDDPQLTARVSAAGSERSARRQPARVIMDSRLRVPLGAKVLTSSGSARTIIVTSTQASPRRIEQLQARGVTIIRVSEREGHASLEEGLTRLGQMGITSIMLEGGSELNAMALRCGVVNRVRFYIAPVLLGGQNAKGVIGGIAPKRLTGAYPVEEPRLTRVGRDFIFEGRIHT
jgi:diaminohydroxyphosphoribosylaminopyrimidine deaminase/5-amino-6-(5-phosphoribosylamino)uracil reductase